MYAELAIVYYTLDSEIRASTCQLRVSEFTQEIYNLLQEIYPKVCLKIPTPSAEPFKNSSLVQKLHKFSLTVRTYLVYNT